MRIDPAYILEARRELASRSLADFAKMAWPILEPATPLKWGWALDAICDHLEAVSAGDLRRLLINVPPGPMRADSIVETGRGPRRLDEVEVGDFVLTHRGRYRRVEAVHDQGVLPILKITTNSGRETFAAPSHPYLTPRGWVEAGELRTGDILAVVNRQEERPEAKPMSPEEARFLGYIVGDGAVTHSPGFVNNDPDIIRDFQECAAALGFETTARQRSGQKFWTVGVRGARKFLASHDLLGKNSYTKRIPSSVMNADKATLGNFLGAYWSCDGGIDVRATRSRGSKYRAYATTVSEHLALDLVQALALFGIESRLRRKSRALETARQPGGRYHSFSVEVQNEPMTARVLALPELCAVKRESGAGCIQDFDRLIWGDPIVQIEPQDDAHCMCLTVAEDHSFTCSGIAVKNSMKSLLTSVLWPAWEWGPRTKPQMRFLGTAHAQHLAIRDNTKCRRLIQSRWYQRLWPIQLTGDQNAKSKFENTATGFREAMAFTSMTGSRGDRVILDDPHSVDDANSVVKLDTDIVTFREALPSRVNNDESAIVIIMQRLHEKDVSAVALELGYDHLCIPMRYEEGRSKWVVGTGDPRARDGELMFEERFPAWQVEELEKTLGSYAAAGQLQQRPAPREGGLFKPSWFNVIRAMPNDIIRTVRGWDLAATEQYGKSDPDWTAGVLMSKRRDGRYLVHGCTRFRGTPFDVEKAVLRHALKDPPRTTIRLPQDPGQAGKAQAAALTRKLAGHSVKCVRPTGDKAARATPLAVQAEAGNVDILITGDAVADAWVQPFLDELCLFPAGSHDDQVDAAADAFNELALGGSSYSLAALAS